MTSTYVQGISPLSYPYRCTAKHRRCTAGTGSASTWRALRRYPRNRRMGYDEVLSQS